MAQFSNKHLMLLGLGLSIAMGTGGYLLGRSPAPAQESSASMPVIAAKTEPHAHLTPATNAAQQPGQGHDAVGHDAVATLDPEDPEFARPLWTYAQPWPGRRIASLSSNNVVTLEGGRDAGQNAGAKLLIIKDADNAFGPQVDFQINKGQLDCSRNVRMECAIDMMFDGKDHQFFVNPTGDALSTFRIRTPGPFMQALRGASNVTVFANISRHGEVPYGFVVDGLKED